MIILDNFFLQFFSIDFSQNWYFIELYILILLVIFSVVSRTTSESPADRNELLEINKMRIPTTTSIFLLMTSLLSSMIEPMVLCLAIYIYIYIVLLSHLFL